MAKVITDEKIKFSIEINGNTAQKDLLELEKSTRRLNETNKELLIQKKRLEAQGKKDTAEYKQLTATIKANNAVIDANKEKMKALQAQIGITGLTLTQLRQKATVLRATLSNMIPGTEDFRRYQAELSQVNARIGELTGRATQARFSLGSMADGFNRYQALAVTFIATLTGVVLSIQKIIDINGKLSDAQSDVMKTTGMTREEVDELTKSFGALKTRTARIELLALATEAGRLGIEGVENVQAFVEQANKLKVALGDDLSDEAIREVGKMVNVYKVGDQTGRDFAGSMDALGSSINEVSASGANQAGFLVDYLKRQAGIAAQAKLSAADNIGYAATFDEIGQSVEVSATAMNKVWMDMFQNPAQFAKIAGMSIKDFNQLLATDSNEAMLKFLEGLKGNDAGLQVMLESMKDLEVGGARGVQALAALANNTELLRARQVTSNQALIESTSLTNEYALKNENLAATYEKIIKTVTGWFSSETIVNGLSSYFSWFAKLIGATEDLDGSVTRFRDRLIVFLKVLTILVVSLLSYNAALRLTALWTKTVSTAQAIYNMIATRGAVATNLLRSSQLLLSSAYYLVTGNVTRATAAMRLFNMVSKMNPIGLLLGVLSALAVALVTFGNKSKDASKSLQDLSSQMKIQSAVQKQFEKDFASSSQALKAKVEPLISILKDQNLSLHTRKKAYEELIKISPTFTGTVDKEYLATEKLDSAYKSLLESMAEKMRFQAMQKVMQKTYDDEAKAIANIIALETKKKELDAEQERFQKSRRDNRKNVNLLLEQNEINDQLAEAYKVQEQAQKNQNQILDYRKKQIEDLNQEQKKYKEGTVEWLELQKKIDALIGTSKTSTTLGGEVVIPVTTTTTTTSDKGDAARKAKEAQEQRLEQLRKNADEELKLRRELEDAILANMDESYQKEWQLEQTNWTRRIEDLQNRLVLESEIELAQKKANNSKLSSEERAFWASQAKSWQANNNHIYGLIQTAEQTHQLKLKAIREKAGKQLIETEKQAFDDAQLQREINHNLELAQLGTDEEAKRRLKEQYEKESLEAQEEFLNKQVDKIQSMLDGASIGGVDYSLLSEEAKEKLERDVQVILLALAKIQAAKNGETSENGQSNFDKLGLQGATDILGFTPENWEQFFANLETGTFGIEEMTFAVSALSNMWSQYGQMVAAGENARLRDYEKNTQRKSASLKRQLDSGMISQTQYNRAVETLETQLDKKKAQIEYEQAKRQKQMAIVKAVIDTATGIMGVWSNPGYPMAIPLSVLIGAMGAMQIATISKQPLPSRGYEEGLYPEYTKREQDGKLFRTGRPKPMRSGLYKKSTVLVGEGPGDQPEMVIDKKTWPKISPAVQDALLREIRGVKGFEKGYYDNAGVMQVPVEPTTPNQTNPENVGMMMMAEALNRNSAILEKIDREGVLAKVLANDYKSMENLKEGLEKYNELKSKARR